MDAQQIIDKLAQSVIGTFNDDPDKSVTIDDLVSSVETDLNNDEEDGVFQEIVDLVAEQVEKSGYTVIYPEGLEGEEEEGEEDIDE